MKKKTIKRNQGYDYSDIQELAVYVMRKFPKVTGNLPNKDGQKYRWNAKAENLITEYEKRITQGTYNKPAHQALKHKLIRCFTG